MKRHGRAVRERFPSGKGGRLPSRAGADLQGSRVEPAIASPLSPVDRMYIARARQYGTYRGVGGGSRRRGMGR
ncbi:MAG TPA: hypothetical protein VF618_11125 [Thermoanaerobaculia bacterium]